MKLVKGSIVAEEGDTIPTAEQTSSEDTRTDDDIYPRCESCGLTNYEWTPGTRGRKPRYHVECKPVEPKRRASRSAAWETPMREALTSRYMQLGNVASIFHPAYGMGIKQRIDEAVEADIEYARTNAKFRDFLEKSLERTALGAVIAVHGAMLAPIATGLAANRGNRKPPARSGTRRPDTPPSTPRNPQASSVPVPEPDNVRDFPIPEPSVTDEPSNPQVTLDGMPG